MKASIAIGVLTSLFFAISLFLPTEKIIAATTLDDTFYYLQIARNFAQGKGLTFDGYEPTNGFHPLWLAVLVPIAYFFPGDEVLLRLALGLCALLIGVSAALLWRLLQPIAQPFRLISFLLILLGWWAAWILFSGMETSLLLALLLLLLHHYAHLLNKPTPSQTARLGLLSALLILTRIDMSIVVGGLGTGLLLYPYFSLSQRVRITALWGGMTLLLVLPYFTANWLLTQHLLPINGVVKTPQGSLTERLLHNLLPLQRLLQNFLGLDLPSAQISAYLIIALFIALALYFIVRFLLFQTAFFALGSLLLASLTHLFIQLILVDKLYPWHLTTEILSGGVLYGIVFSESSALPYILRKLLAWTIAIPAFALAVSLLYFRWKEDGRGNLYLSFYRAAQWIRHHIPIQARLAAWDAGILGYFSHRSTTNLDGLVNSYAYLPYLRGDSIPAYLRKENIDYLAQYFSASLPTDSPWRSLLGDTAYAEKFIYRRTGLLHEGQAIPAEFLIMRLRR
ncbi:MAG: hypothetical protein RMK98_03585 [Bacteroidia bacterium]|nr:hypothetical protein [Bacteroidia bacterium]